MRRLLLIDAGWMLLACSRPLILAHLFAALLVGAMLVLFQYTLLSVVLFGIALCALILQCFYYATGIALIGLKPRHVRFLLSSPFVIIWLAAISLVSVWRTEGKGWVRTPRQ